MENKIQITEDMLLLHGWQKVENSTTIMQKEIENINPLNDDDEDTGIKLILHTMYNSEQFAVVFPDGAMLNFSPKTMNELNAFEEMISFFDPPY